jgi:hypothetical protein
LKGVDEVMKILKQCAMDLNQDQSIRGFEEDWLMRVRSIRVEKFVNWSCHEIEIIRNGKIWGKKLRGYAKIYCAH